MNPVLVDTPISESDFKARDDLLVQRQQMLVAEAAAQTTAQQNEVKFKGKTPKVYDDSTGVKLERIPIIETKLPKMLGAVPIHSGFLFTQTCPDSSLTGAISLQWEVYDHGEHLDSESERCEFLSAAASDRFIGGATAALRAYRKAAETLLAKRADGCFPLLETALSHQAELHISEDLLKLENRCVTATLGKSKRIAPFVRCVLLPESCTSHVEVKLMETDRGEVSWQIGVPFGCIKQDTADHGERLVIDREVPVTWRYYSSGHAHSAVLKKVYFEGNHLSFDEDMEVLCSKTWKEMRYGLLSRITDQACRCFSTH